MASRKHTTPAVQLDFSFTEAEEWRAVPGYEGFYEVSSLGRVRSLDRLHAPRVRQKQGRVLRLLARKKKYLAVRLSKAGQIKMWNVHALVLMAFVGPRPSGYEGNHIDGNSLNNTAANLEWVTPLVNMRHAYAMGLIPLLPSRGEENPQARLKDADIVAIRHMHEAGIRNKDIAATMGVSAGTISMITHGQRWKHVP